MKLLLDCGNTRLKWAVYPERHGRDAERRGVCEYNAHAIAALCTALGHLPLASLIYASVIAPAREQTLFEQLQSLGIPPQRFVVTHRAGTLTNAYASPETLGVDRWAAAIGAWGLLGEACLVISAGTATTIDLVELQADHGVYRGGLILPGLELMRDALHQRAARLPQAAGRYRSTPDVADNTHDAITSGAIEATCGAIERMGRRLPQGAPWLVTGGNARQLDAVLPGLTVIDDLVLTGLARAPHEPSIA